MPSLLLRRDDADAAEINKGTTYIVLGIVFGALAIVCLLITVYLLARLRRADKKLDRELANAPAAYNDDFAPQFKEKHSLSMDYSNDYNYEYARAHVVAPSLPADIIHVGPMPPSPAPIRPVRRPSSLFDRKRASNTPKPPTPHLPDYYNVPPVPRPVPSPGAAQESFERSPPQPAGLTPMPPPRSPPVTRIVAPNSPQRVPVPMPTPPQPVARPDTLVLPTRPESFTSEYSEYSVQPRDRDQLQTAVSEAPTVRPGFGRSPSLLRKVLHERVGGAAAPAVPSIPEEHRPMVTLSLASVLMPYELESATPGPTPVDVRRPPRTTTSTSARPSRPPSSRPSRPSCAPKRATSPPSRSSSPTARTTSASRCDPPTAVEQLTTGQ
ncbi:hypothetical protein EXIGLDRAFT_831453 [Exidia glandulosa HHB12029]|uniref:Uncharacterized protein n=1 Tax=Exidia glandulosa HHB12029 TaxID=1314781 RepID=A0A165MN70_EXIGL|nr:hypothetical protein EXIGLDRAFT_831453 [Exidia glandulosa HHB12029]